MIARMQIRETAWNALLSEYQTCVDTEACSLSQDIQKILRTGCTHIVEDAQSPAGFILVDCIGPESRIDELYNYFDPSDRIGYGDSNGPWKWGFDGKVNFPTEYTGQHNDILASQPTGSTFEDENWGHGWLGQGTDEYLQLYAREHSREFGEEFG